MKKLLVLLVAVAMLTVSFAALADEYLVFSTGGTTGTYYAFGGEISALLTQRLMNGDISMRPGQIKDWIACDKCDFKDICRHEQAEVRDLQMDSQEAFEKMISEEAEDPLEKK